MYGRRVVAIGARILLRQAAGDRAHVIAGRLDRCAGLETRNDLDVMRATLGLNVLGAELERNPELRLQRKLEALRHDANYFARYAIDLQWLTDDARIGSESPRPQRMAEYHDIARPFAIVIVGDRPTEPRRRPHDRKETAGNVRGR